MITYILIGINIVVFILTYAGRLDDDDLAVSYHWIHNRGQYYRLLTSAFTHRDITHLAFNMVSLYNVGSFVEYYFGKGYFLLLYFGSMILGKLLALTIRHNNRQDYLMSMGASGAICGVLGAYFMVIIFHYGLSGIQELIRPMTSLVIMSILPGVDGVSHFSCMAMGMAIAYVLIMFL